MDTDTQVDTVVEDVLDTVDDTVDETSEASPDERRVPLSALQRERKQRQEEQALRRQEEIARHRMEVENQYLKEQFAKMQAPPVEDDSVYENATKADLAKERRSVKQEVTDEIMQKLEAKQRDAAESSWVASNSEKAEYVTQNLKQFLDKRPHLTSAIENAPNRYEEAYALMNAFNPRKSTGTIAKSKASPGHPSAVPKSANIDAVGDVMSMSDKEFLEWRQSKRRR